MFPRFHIVVLVLGFFVLVGVLSADTVQLVNGDTVSGKVLALDREKLLLKSEVFGEMTIVRSKIAAIHFGDAPVQKKATAPVKPETGSVQGLLDQIRSSGVDPKTMNDLKKAFPLLATPEAGKYFEDVLGGLMTGKLNLQDIRKDAQKALDELKKLEKDLGPDAAQALAGYKGILENFIRRSMPKK